MRASQRVCTSRRERGAAMLLVLIALAVVTVMALSFLASQEPTALVASNIDRKAKARAIAESALKMAIDYVNEDAAWRTDKTSGQWMTGASLDGGTFDLYGVDEDDGDLADDSTDAVTLSVVATYDGVTHRVSATVTPGGSGSTTANRLLLVVGNDITPSTQDSDKRTTFEAWGYTVTLIDDSAVQASFDAALAVNDVVYVSEEVRSGNVDTKLRDTTLGVVNEEGYLQDQFGFTTGDTYNDDTATYFTLTDNSHSITQGFSLGGLDIYNSSSQVTEISTTLASGVQTLGTEADTGLTDESFMVAETGATLHYGSAAGRRVMLPTGSEFDITDLTTDGITVWQRSLQWAAGAGTGPTLLALYEFMEQPVALPTLVGHWQLDEEPAPGFGGASAGDKIELNGSARIDSYVSSSGTYASQTPGDDAIVTMNGTGSDDFIIESSAYIGGDGYIGAGGNPSSVYDIDGTLTGSQNVQTSNIPITTLTAPTGLPSSSGNYSQSSGNVVFSSDVTYGTFTLSSSATVTISGNVTLHVTGNFVMTGSSQIVIPSGSSLILYTGDDVDIDSSAQLNGDSSATNRLTLYGYGYKHIDLKGSAVMAGAVYTNDELHIKDSSHFYGIVLAKDKVKIEDSGEFHQDLALGGFGTGGSAITFGNQSPGSGSRVNDDDQLASKFTLTEAMTITSISAYVYGGDDGGYVRLAIYDHDSADNEPGNLLAQSSSQWVSNDTWQWETGTISSTLLAPGTYWLAMGLDNSDDDMRYRYTSGGVTEETSNKAEDDGFDPDWDDSYDEGSHSHTMTIYASGTANNSGMPDAADETITANDGVYEGDAVGGYAGFGDGGTSIWLDSDGDYIEIPHDAAYLLDAGTISLHAYPTSTTGTQGLFSKDSSGNDNGGQVTLYTIGTRVAAVIETTTDDPYGTGDTITLQSSTGTINKDQWNHVALTWGDGQVRLYHDGVLVASANHLGGLGTTAGGSGNNEPIVIGASSGTSGNNSATPITDEFEGRIDDLRIYDLPIDAAQAINLASASDPGPRTAPGYVIADTSGFGDPADMLIYDINAVTWIGGGAGLQFTGDTIATTLGPAAKIHDAIEASEAFAIELILTRASPGTTDMPSHLLGYSNDPDVHNFLIGQDDANYEARVRDSATGNDARLSPELVSASDLNTPGETHLVVTYDAGEVRVYIDGVLDETATAGGTLNNWDSTLMLVLGGAYDDSDHWLGTIRRIAIYNAAFNQYQAENVFNGEEPGDGAGIGGAGTVVWDELD